jgi:hypothetical protein
VGVTSTSPPRTRTRLEELLPLYRSWASSAEVRFVNVGTEVDGVASTPSASGEAGMMIDIHDEYRLTATSAPAQLMTVEGIRGNEECPRAHNCALPSPFPLRPATTPPAVTTAASRTLAPTSSPSRVTTPMAVLSSTTTRMYKAEPELDFCVRCRPFVTTRAPSRQDRTYATIGGARDAWFVGSINALELRTLTIPLAFHDPASPTPRTSTATARRTVPTAPA